MKLLLPSLPTQNTHKEADFGIAFRRWWNAQKSPLQGEIELKDTRGRDYLPFAEFSHDQEVIYNLASSSRGVLVRRSIGTTGGADYSGLVRSAYWIVIKYKKAFHIISVNAFLLERDRSKRKSLTEARAREIATISVSL